MGDLTWTNDARRLGDLIPWEHNPRQIKEAEAGRLLDSLETFGQFQTIAIEPDNEIVDGHQRKAVWAAAAKYGPDFQVDVRVANRKLTEREKQQLSVYAHKGAVGEFDFDELANWGIEDELLEWGFSKIALGLESFDFGDESEYDITRQDVPDALFPSDNEWGIPTLDLSTQAEFVELPVTKWGDVSRKSKMRGTYHFYTDDYKFDALWADPSDLINSGCVAMIEPNFSSNEQMPMAAGLWGIYRKRWLARYAQSFGIRVFADLNVSPKFARLNLLGVPQGWRAFATRGLSGQMELIENDYQIASELAGKPPLFLVYGGGKDVEAHCKERGHIWIPENMHVKDGRKAEYG